MANILRFLWDAPLINLPVALQSPRLLLRVPQMDDWEQWAALRQASRANLEIFEPRWTVDALTRANFLRRVRKAQQDWRHDKGYHFLIFRQDDKCLLGGVSLGQVRRGAAEAATLGYWMGSRFARQGIMREAAGMVVAFAFDQLGLQRVEASCLPHNEASQRLLLGLGFSHEGYARQYLEINGVREDHLLFARLMGDKAGD